MGDEMLWKKVFTYYLIFTEKSNLVRMGLSKLFISFGSEIKIQNKAEYKQNYLPNRKPQQFYFNYLNF